MSETYVYTDATGIITADTSDLQDTVESEYKTTFGQDVTVTADTLLGKQVTGEVTARKAAMVAAAAMGNQINPNYAGGIYLDAICAFLGKTRAAATFTKVPSVTLTGVARTLIAAGSQAESQSTGYFYTLDANVTLDDSGNGSGNFTCSTAGAIACPVGDLKIGTNVLGWETVNNTVAGTPGSVQQSDASLLSDRNVQLALQGTAMPEAITSKLNNTDGVTSIKFQENYTDAAVTMNGIAMVAHSIWACVLGGTDNDVATSLLAKKSGGCAWNGATTVDITDAASGQLYVVQFDRPTQVPLIARVTYRIGTYTGDPSTAIPQAIADYADKLVDEFEGFDIGVNVSPFEIGAAIVAQLPGIIITKVEMATAAAGTGSYSTNEVPITYLQYPSIATGSIVVQAAT